MERNGAASFVAAGAGRAPQGTNKALGAAMASQPPFMASATAWAGIANLL